MKTILLIEDEEQVAELMKTILDPDYLVITHKTGEGAARGLAHVTPDLIILDLFLAGSLGGLEMIAVLRATPGSSQVPIIAISGQADRGTIDRALSLGANTFIAKPYSPTRLLGEIERLLNE